jgi:hypothetical protein
MVPTSSWLSADIIPALQHVLFTKENASNIIILPYSIGKVCVHAIIGHDIIA